MKRNALFIIGAALLAVILAWYFLLYKPLGEDLTKAQAETTAERSKTSDLANNLRRLQAQAKNAPQQQAFLRKLDEAIPQNADLAEFLLQADDIAIDAGVDFTSITPSPPVAGGGSASTIALSINVTGSFFQVKNYLTQLESLERLVMIDSVTLAAGGSSAGGSSAGATGSSTDSSDTTTLSVTLTGRMFTRAAPAGAGATTPGGTTTTTTTAPSTGSTTAPAGSSTTGGA